MSSFSGRCLLIGLGATLVCLGRAAPTGSATPSAPANKPPTSPSGGAPSFTSPLTG